MLNLLLQTSNPSQITKLISSITKMLPLVIDEIEGGVQKPLMQLSFIVAAIMTFLALFKMMNYFAKVEFDEVIKFFVRTILLIILVASAASVVNKLEIMGQAIGNFTPIRVTLKNQQMAFDGSFRAMTKHYFEVEPGSIGTLEAVMGALREAPTTNLDDLVREDDPNSLKRMFAGLNIGRGILEFANIFLLVMTEWILLAFRLAGPFMVAMAIDPDTRKKMSIPFLWTVLIFTLVTPLISQIIRIILYALANMAIRGLDTENYLFVYDPATSEILMRDATGGSPVYAALFGGIGMGIAGLVLMASPYISYKLCQGQIFEAVSSTLSGWIAGVTGSVLEYAGVRASSTIQRQAEQQQAQGQYDAQSTMAEAQKRVADIQARMGRNSAESQAAAARAAGIANTMGAYNAAVGAAGTNYATALAIFGHNRDSQVGQIQIGMKKEAVATDIAKDKEVGASFNSQNNESKKILSSVTRSAIGSLGLGGEGGSLVPGVAAIGAGVGGAMDLRTAAVTNLQNRQNIRSAAETTQLNIHDAALKNITVQDVYRKGMEGAEKMRRDGLVSSASIQRDSALSGINQSYGIQMANARNNYGLHLQANQITQTAQMKSAEITRDATFKSANERALAQVIATMSRDISRRLEQGITMRF
ncbi:MAG: hypothetical protein JNM09_00240 [Blastocatellia bacterium]|nr:hypothetical protein [Blastocatellia bacterium]